MLRFLKWIFFVFGGLGLLVMSFFYIQNKTDLHLYFGNKSTLEYDSIKVSCKEVESEYYFNCFYKNFAVYLQKVSLTGISLGLKTAFTFIDEDKMNNTLHKSKANDIRFAINHLKVNNLALKNSTKRFHGLEFTYGGYIGKVSDFLEKGMAFSDGILVGLKGDEGISSLTDEGLRSAFNIELKSVEKDYKMIQVSINSWLDSEIKQLKEKHEVQ